MSSLARRACYKCGNVGHYAGQQERERDVPLVDGLADMNKRFVLLPSACATTVSVEMLLYHRRLADLCPGKQPGV